MKRKVYVTGEDPVEHLATIANRKGPRCYVCRRRNGDKSVLLMVEGEKVSSRVITVDVGWVEVKGRKMSFFYPFCDECFKLGDCVKELVKKSTAKAVRIPRLLTPSLN